MNYETRARCRHCFFCCWLHSAYSQRSEFASFPHQNSTHCYCCWCCCLLQLCMLKRNKNKFSIVKKPVITLMDSKFSLLHRACCRVTQLSYQLMHLHKIYTLTFWRRNYFFYFSTPVYKMWIIQEPNMLELWNKLHFEEKKTDSIYYVYNIQYLYLLNKYINHNFRG